ncbi:MAG: phosphate signaling complex protein PhoU [Alphaproteobacteria bacterium]|nr:phosphate signaling complex protein PhoU [Alphaproteobacteria bacterium]MBU0796600.1 phosphate signaling complex protein PhoU [Alphaproteobacteria bacterium]MBU0886331.1 phosphate signaling complex protein PhoU [Alphaproteobacteria bacterium]MBU1813473.1 phosphate signaling complex protein PhoU [Alphaproteobacteria bacterium]MBU2090226.1 phosphate signaling complex protein PhoU [Alphaproteobacteria bacterium]
MPAEHSVKSFDEELKRLQNLISQMGGLVETQVQDCLQSLAKRDSTMAERVIKDDPRIDALEYEINELTVRMLALRQPMAEDLRRVVGALKISSDLERIGDYAANISKRAIALNQMPPARPAAGIPRMGRMVQQILKEMLDAYVEQDAEKALQVWRRDEEVDEMYTSLFREMLTYMMEDPRNISPCTHLLFMAKNIERIGDHATNIAETLYYQVTGRPLTAERPKGDTSSFTVVEPDGSEHVVRNQ